MGRDLIISHVRQSDRAIQDNDTHMRGVAERAAQFASEFGMGEWGRVMGMLHDKGKEKNAFQQHILKETGLEPRAVVRGDYSHAYVGALIAKQLFPKYYRMIDNALMGHHRGLYDDGDREKVQESILPNDVVVDRINADLSVPKITEKKDVHHLLRMLYSCLVDADYLDTEAFVQPEQSKKRGGHVSLVDLESKLEAYLRGLKDNAAHTDVNKVRDDVQKYCLDGCNGPQGYYSLTVPTGGGKTLASILWAVKHAIKNNQRRVIIAIPYTSIITQTASVLRRVFGEENVLEHHSNVDYSKMDNCDVAKRQQLATENWDYPIVVTTNVQLFESLFSNKPSTCRKLHNIVKSVLILDEVQTLPREYLQPIVDSLDTLVRVFGVSVLFTTASQPVLSGHLQGTNPFVSFNGLPSIKELIPRGANLHEKLRRVELKYDDVKKDYDDIAAEMVEKTRVLCIVNTRNDAKEIYTRLPKGGSLFHLSRMMCPGHIGEVIARIKDVLKQEPSTIVRVVATQLIEAGVDIDFPVVLRQESGLDSILQAAGRCNREGTLKCGETRVFCLDKPLPPGYISDANNARLNMKGEYDWFSPEAMEAYFLQLYSRASTFDKPEIAQLLYKSDMQFETAASVFHLIDDTTIPVIVNWKNSMELVERLKREGVSYPLMKKLSQYTVNVRERDLKILYGAGAIEEILEGVYTLCDAGYYDGEVGLRVENNWLEESLIV